MKYGESTFDIIYLFFAVISAVIMLVKAKKKIGKLMGLATLILGLGDAFHLVPRVLNYFVEADFTAALGIGKLVTSITMTLFYVLVYYIYLGYLQEQEYKRVTGAVWALTMVRIVLCLLPQNGWKENSADMTWGIIRNIPFTLLGLLIVVLFYQKRKQPGRLKSVWMLVLLSFAFYIPVAVGAGEVPILGMLMLPKTVCYMLLIRLFLLAVVKDEN